MLERFVVLLILTLMVIIHKIPLEDYKGILEVLGIPTLFGMIVQSFIHQKPEDIPNGGSNVEKVTSTTVTSVVAPVSTSTDSAK